MCNPKGLGTDHVRGLQNSLYTPLEWSFTGEVKPISDFVRGTLFTEFRVFLFVRGSSRIVKARLAEY